MMHEIFHLLGFCSDSSTHVNIMSVLADNQMTKQISMFAKQVCNRVKSIFKKEV